MNVRAHERSSILSLLMQFLRYQWSKLAKQLSSSSSSPSSQRHVGRLGAVSSASSSYERRSQYVVSDAPVPPRGVVPPLSKEADSNRTSPPNLLSHTPHSESSTPLPPPPPFPPSTAPLSVVLPEKHSENPLFNESEEEERSKPFHCHN